MEVIYAVFVAPDVHAGKRELPGVVRQRVREAIDVGGLDIPDGVEVRRVRLER